MMIKPPMFTVPNSLNVVPSVLNRVPCITAFGTRFPPTFWYPSKVHKYKPLKVPLQTRPSAAAAAVADVLNATTRQTTAQVKDRALIIILVNFVFIVIVFLSLDSYCFSLLWLLVIELLFPAVHHVLGGIWRLVTRKFLPTLKQAHYPFCRSYRRLVPAGALRRSPASLRV